MNTSPSFPPLGLAEILPEHAGVTADGVLSIGGVPATELAARYGTPLYVYDEEGLRRTARRFVEGLHARWPNSDVLFASKSFPAVGMYALAQEEGLCVDVAGGGELVLALAAGVSPERLFMHGNAKSDEELRLALDAGVGTIIVDNTDELDRLERLLTRPQDLLLRVIPGVDAHTHATMATGGDDSKFGLPLDQAAAAVRRMEAHPLMRFRGVHLHIGSQILETEQFAQAVRNIADVGSFDTYDVGGGLGIKYSYADDAPSIESYLDAVVAAAREVLPAGARLLIEPGRSLVARAGITLYEVLVAKRTGRHFVAVNGGLADQMEFPMTGQRAEAVLANRMLEPWESSVKLVGRQCESGDTLVDGAPMPDPRVGDLVALLATGAYGYTMANNYNGALKPAIVFVKDGESRLVAKRESYQELLALHSPALEAGAARDAALAGS
jgi:diaminopimelate decarboxylase